jgi:hypothetical protein
MAMTAQEKYKGMTCGPFASAWEPDGPWSPASGSDAPTNSSHVNAPTLTALLQEPQRTQDLAARKNIVFDIQR